MQSGYLFIKHLKSQNNTFFTLQETKLCLKIKQAEVQTQVYKDYKPVKLFKISNNSNVNNRSRGQE